MPLGCTTWRFVSMGVIGAHDIDDLLDKAQLLAQIPQGNDAESIRLASSRRRAERPH